MKPSELPGTRRLYRLTNRALAQIRELWQYAGEDELPPDSLDSPLLLFLLRLLGTAVCMDSSWAESMPATLDRPSAERARAVRRSPGNW
jgi:hypothetical protein